MLLRSPSLAAAGGAGAARRIDDEQRRFENALRSRIPSATVHWRYRLVANGISVVLPSRDLPRLAGLPGVREVFAPATYRALAGPDAVTIGARELPAADLPNAGAGIKIGIIDDGVDQTHRVLRPGGLRDASRVSEGPGGVHDGEGHRRPRRSRRPARPGATPPSRSTRSSRATGRTSPGSPPGTATRSQRARGSAGSRRARTSATTRRSPSRPTPNVGLDGNAPEIVAAIEAAVADGMDVINLSIGEPEIEPSRDVVALALDAAAAAGVVPVVAAGNDFDEFGLGSVSSPGTSARAITVGRDDVRHRTGHRRLLLAGPDAGLAPAQARRRRPGRVDPLVRARRVGDVVGDEHGRAPRRRVPSRSCSSGIRTGRRSRSRRRSASRRGPSRSAASPRPRRVPAPGSSTSPRPTSRSSVRPRPRSRSGSSGASTTRQQRRDARRRGRRRRTVGGDGRVARSSGRNDRDRRTRGRRPRAADARTHAPAPQRRRGLRRRRAPTRRRSCGASRSGAGSPSRSSRTTTQSLRAARRLRGRHAGPPGARRRLPLPGGAGRGAGRRRASPAPSRSSASASPAGSRTSASSSPSAARGRGSSPGSSRRGTRTG